MTALSHDCDRIEVFFLPIYNPVLNRDERLNTDMKYAISTSVFKRNSFQAGEVDCPQIIGVPFGVSSVRLFSST